jgi:hypothetical protein
MRVGRMGDDGAKIWDGGRANTPSPVPIPFTSLSSTFYRFPLKRRRQGLYDIATLYWTKKCHNRDDSINLHTHRRERCKSQPHLLKVYISTLLVAQNEVCRMVR